MSYYSEYEEEATENDGSSESKWDPIADINIISAVMKLLTEITKSNGGIGEISSLNFKKQGDGLNMSAKMEISTPTWTMNWVNTDLENSKNSSFVFSLTPDTNQPKIDSLLALWTNWEESEKPGLQEAVGSTEKEHT